MVYQQEPDSIIWCIRDDGVLAGLTYQRSEMLLPGIDIFLVVLLAMVILFVKVLHLYQETY